MTLYHISIKKIIKRCTFSIFAASLLLSSAAFSGCSLKANTAENSDAVLSGCSSKVNTTQTADSESQEPISTTAIKLNTAVTITIYDSQNKNLLTECMNLCDKYEKIFSRTASDSELYKLNHRQLTPVDGTDNTYQVSDSLAELIQKGLYYSDLSDGAFDIAIEPLTSLWDFTAEDPQVPEDSLIQNALSKCDYHNISVGGKDNNEITLKTDDTAIELGAIAKGYIADRIKDYLKKNGVKHAVIDLGGNILLLGSKTDGSKYNIGIQKPFGETGEPITSIKVANKSVVTTGIYQRYFEADGKIYHHILDPRTGYPCENTLYSDTIITDSSLTADALSTVCYLMGYEAANDLIDQLENVDALFITNDNEIHYTKNFLR